MTPQLARKLDPDSVPDLKALCLGGEAFTKKLLTLWSHRLRLFQFYGPSECSINSSTREIDNPNADPPNIGLPNSAACWVIMPGSHNNDVEFIKNDPKFHDFVFYKTGDLVRWNSDGTLLFRGRADTQVKPNGQRLELGEIEYHLALEPEIHIAIALVPKAGHCQGNLVAVIMPKMGSSDRMSTQDISILYWRKDANMRHVVDGIKSKLYDVLPRYMVPKIWAFLACMPMSSFGKVARVRIRGWVEGINDEAFSKITGEISESGRNLDYATTLERQISEIWSSVIKRPRDRVGLNRPLVFLGGDLVQAQDVVARRRLQGIRISIRDVLSYQGVAEASSHATVSNAPTGSHPTTRELEILERWSTEGYMVVLKILQPNEVPSLEIIVARGELMTREDVQR
ncbi:putative HC-toxin synthetase [Rosellinia necatrix]|uniref:Putative HC-toxin synthetase n=1 Tax=Rosellinia necatrix TaxID=77044 RepID=A0A1S8A5S1_ROSNE|nr:putative HC-toxin synthetase [Rosellinia necatrix]